MWCFAFLLNIAFVNPASLTVDTKEEKDKMMKNTRVSIYRKNTTRIVEERGYFMVTDCFFSEISSNNNGGAVCINTNELSILYCDLSSFSNCSVSGDSQGGAIFFSSVAGGFSILSKICFIHCFTDNLKSNQFVVSASSHRGPNAAHFCTFSQAFRKHYQKSISFTFLFGNQSFVSLNVSHNALSQLGCGHFASAIKNVIKFSTFFNNQADQGTSILYNAGCQGLIQLSNIVNNTGNRFYISKTPMIYSFRSTLVIETTIFHNNLYYLFGKTDGSLDVFRCWIPQPYDAFGIHIFRNKGETSTYILTHLQTYLCEADFPLKKLD